MKIWFSLPFFCFMVCLHYSCGTYPYEYIEYDENMDKVDTALVSKYLLQSDTLKIIAQINNNEVSDKQKNEIVVKEQFTIQLGAFVKELNAVNLVNNASEKLNSNITYRFSDGFFKVFTRTFATEPDAIIELEKIKHKGFIDSFVVVK